MLAIPKARQAYEESLSQMRERIKKTIWGLLGQAVDSVIGTASMAGNSVSARGLDLFRVELAPTERCKLAAGFHLVPNSGAGPSSCAHLQEGHTGHWDQSWKPTQNTQTSKKPALLLCLTLCIKNVIWWGMKGQDRAKMSARITEPGWAHTNSQPNCDNTHSVCTARWCPACYTCVLIILLVYLFEINTMAVLLSAHRTPTGFKLFTSLFLWKVLLFFKSVSYHIHFVSYSSYFLPRPWLRALPLSVFLVYLAIRLF